MEVKVMKKRLPFLGIMVVSLFMLPSVSLAQHGHGHGAASKMETRTVLVEGVKVVFEIMDNAEHRKMLKDMKMKEDIEPGTTHNITVTLKDGKTDRKITNAEIQMKVVDPKGKDQIKTLKYEDHMESFDAYFNLPQKGRYQVIILARIGEERRTAGIYYEVK